MDMVMAGGADHKGFASPVRHCLGPLGLERSGYAEVGQLANVVDLHVVRLLAYLARIREESGDELLLRIVDPDRLTVSDRRRFLPLERYNARRLLIEAAWHHRPRYRPSAQLLRRQNQAAPGARDRAERAH